MNKFLARACSTNTPKIVFLSTFQSPSISQLPSLSSLLSMATISLPHFTRSLAPLALWIGWWDENSSAKCGRKASFYVHERLNISLINLNGFHFLSLWLLLDITFLSAQSFPIFLFIHSILFLDSFSFSFSFSDAGNFFMQDAILDVNFCRRVFSCANKKNDYISLHSSYYSDIISCNWGFFLRILLIFF